MKSQTGSARMRAESSSNNASKSYTLNVQSNKSSAELRSIEDLLRTGLIFCDLNLWITTFPRTDQYLDLLEVQRTKTPDSFDSSLITINISL